MTAAVLITQRSFGSIMFFHTRETASWFFPYSLSESSWKTSMAPPNSKHEMAVPSWTRGPEGAERSTVSKASSPGRSWVRRPGVTGTRAWILLSSFKTGTCCHLVPITASMQRDLPTKAPRWKNEAEALCAWSPENVPSISQLQKHLCPTAFSWTAVKIYSVRLLSEFLTSQPEAGWSGGCQWAAAGSERGHSFQGLDEMWQKGVRGEPGALSAVDFHQLVIFSSFCIQSTCACWAWCGLTWQWIKIWVRVGPQRTNNLVRNNQLLKTIQIIWNIIYFETTDSNGKASMYYTNCKQVWKYPLGQHCSN